MVYGPRSPGQSGGGPPPPLGRIWSHGGTVLAGHEALHREGMATTYFHARFCRSVNKLDKAADKDRTCTAS